MGVAGVTNLYFEPYSAELVDELTWVQVSRLRLCARPMQVWSRDRRLDHRAHRHTRQPLPIRTNPLAGHQSQRELSVASAELGVAVSFQVPVQAFQLWQRAAKE